MKFEDIRKIYLNFIYNDYKIYEDNDKIYIEYDFEIENLTKFNPCVEILKKDFNFKRVDVDFVKNIVFNIGMIEAISYYKSTCSQKFIIKCGCLDEFQKKWYKKLYYLSLGEFRYINNINIDQDEFVDFVCEGNNLNIINDNESLDGIIIPVGGGKDSIVTLDLLKRYKDKTLCFCIGGKSVSLECIKKAGFEQNDVIEINRSIDENLIDLNEKGFLNGHTPFSAIIAFYSYLVSYLLNKKYIVLSNEDSANETNINGENINHQYSKTIEFENDFREYSEKYLKSGIEYFSILRPITEFQIAMMFSELEEYHNIFKSCNVGSKKEPWYWCNNCSKCLFVYIILSSFLYKEELTNIFKEDLFEKKELLETFIDLCGYGTKKPFECVGTFEEVRCAVTKTIKNIDGELPFLLKYYKENFELFEDDILMYYNKNNNLPEEFDKILKGKILKC